jgi:hypothetical protein
MEIELKDYLQLGGENIQLYILVDLVNARVKTGLPYRAGGLFDQPYFMLAYVEPWIEEAYKGMGNIIPTIGEGDQDKPYHELVAAMNAKMLFS